MDHTYIGAAYYPELWEESEVERDILRCKELGINTLRIGEFAWEKMEPQEGVFAFDWLKRVVDKLYAAGIYTVLCTPSATPPRWLLNKYPETRMVMHDLIRADVSSRCHTCKTSKIIREKNRKVVEGMARAFAGHPGVIGWQLDNEIYPYTEGCYCENCKAAFREWLRARFGTIDALNKAWGMARWSLSYSDFSEVEPPYPKQWRHPSLRKAWRDFQYEQVRTYLNEQAQVLHAHGCTNVGTDMMAHNSMSYNKINAELDVVQYNHYGTAAELADTSFAYDFLRCVKDKPFWVTETQVGWNGSEYAEGGYRPEGACYANTMLPYAMGARMNLYWLFRAHPCGHEIGHGALYSASGRVYRVSDEVKRAAVDLKKCGEFLQSSCIRAKIALHYSSTALNNFEAAPLLKGLNYRTVLTEKYHTPFRRHNVDVIDTQHSLDGYDVVISPFLATVDENGLKERIVAWVKAGGTWIVGPMSDVMDENVRRYTNAPYSFLEELAGVYTKYQKPIDNDVFRAKWCDGTPCGIGTCYDAYECKEGTKSLVSYDGGEFGGLSAVTERKVGKGRVILVGSILSQKDLMRLVNKKPIAQASENIILSEHTGEENIIFAIETENREGYIVLNGKYKDRITNKDYCGKVTISQYQVLALEKIKGNK